MLDSAQKVDTPAQKMLITRLHCQELITLFDECFYQSENTRLLRGRDEPVYLPADSHCPFHRILFAHGYFASALHEIAHWCLAGADRRLQVDYGYWYVADGRNTAQQQAFMQVEVKPQAIEWILADAAGFPFRVSSDNLNGEYCDDTLFKQAIYRQVLSYREVGLPPRAALFRDALANQYATGLLKTNNFCLNSL